MFIVYLEVKEVYSRLQLAVQRLAVVNVGFPIYFSAVNVCCHYGCTIHIVGQRYGEAVFNGVGEYCRLYILSTVYTE